MTWLSLLTIAVGLLIWTGLVVLYSRGALRRRPSFRLMQVPSVDSERFVPTVISLTDSLPCQGQMTGFWVKSDEIFAARLAAVASAQHSIQFETYKMTPGRRADDFAEALVRQAKAGIAIQVTVDDYGTEKMPDSYWQRLREAGIDVQSFSPLSWLAAFDYLRRSHRKLLIIDQQRILIGGAGVSDLWDGTPDTGNQSWFDYEVQFEGEVAGILYGLFVQHWLDSGGQIDMVNQPVKPLHSSVERTDILITSGEDPSYRSSSLRALVETWCLAARSHIWIASPYWLPHADIRRVLVQARQRGVDVRILTMGSNADKQLVYYAARMLYGDLLKADIKICEYQPSMMHAKAILIDQAWVSLGSANIDPRSLFQNDELNVASPDPDLLAKVQQFFGQGFNQSKQIDYHSWRRRSQREKWLGRLALLAYWQL
ncbi:MAG: phosphatidylserine/phosphatidylglycerophosphate/cardiolipin synthase family protein [Leptolyngbya sp. SIO4C1]|nr:phosphatidylserine/phosphatidylglycerophosphate/cardiolipin synthase family protein [Leptolyngbya sp. SIO4C1]